MGIHSVFHRFITSSDFVAAANGASSVAFVAGSDMGDLLMVVSPRSTYHITQLHIALHENSDYAHLSLVTLDSDGASGARIPLSVEYDYHTPAAPSGRIGSVIEFNPPLRIVFSSAANFISTRIETNDSNTPVNAAYSGFILPYIQG